LSCSIIGFAAYKYQAFGPVFMVRSQRIIPESIYNAEAALFEHPLKVFKLKSYHFLFKRIVLILMFKRDTFDNFPFADLLADIEIYSIGVFNFLRRQVPEDLFAVKIIQY